ncbi:amidohydrolase family protein [Actinosynnema sp. NPDC047251]
MTEMPHDGYIDIHAHFTTPATEDQSRRAWQKMLSQGIYLPEPFEWSLDRTLEYMNLSGTAMQFLSNIPASRAALQASNDYGATIVARHPTRFGLLAALPTNNPAAALDEAVRGRVALGASGFAVTANYSGTHLGIDDLFPLWEQLNDWGSVVLVHPDGRQAPTLDHPAPLYEVAFETARTVFDMMFRRVFFQFPNINTMDPPEAIAPCSTAFRASPRSALTHTYSHSDGRHHDRSAHHNRTQPMPQRTISDTTTSRSGEHPLMPQCGCRAVPFGSRGRCDARSSRGTEVGRTMTSWLAITVRWRCGQESR